MKSLPEPSAHIDRPVAAVRATLGGRLLDLTTSSGMLYQRHGMSNAMQILRSLQWLDTSPSVSDS